MIKPLGGTELQYNLLQKYVDSKLLDNFQITTSVPEKIPLAKNKINILWEQNSYDQPNIHPWMQDASNHSKYDWYVFNSHWSAEKYRMFFKLPADKCTVIKNAIDNFPKIKTYKKGDPIKIAYAIDSLTSFLHEEGCQNHLQSQANFYKKFYDWQGRKEDWTNFLTGALNEKS
jgi:hypothetical protein